MAGKHYIQRRLKVKQTLYRPGEALKALGGRGSQNFETMGI
jgi:hypothetical protein